jgi:protein archease
MGQDSLTDHAFRVQKGHAPRVNRGKRMPYRLIDHTADFGIEVFAGDAGELFSEAALALFDQVVDRRCLKGTHRRRVAVTGADWADLMVNWLRELLYLWNGDRFLLCRVAIDGISTRRISATALVDMFDPVCHDIESEIKAVTYHQARVVSEPGRWSARVIFDV